MRPAVGRARGYARFSTGWQGAIAGFPHTAIKLGRAKNLGRRGRAWRRGFLGQAAGIREVDFEKIQNAPVLSPGASDGDRPATTTDPNNLTTAKNQKSH